MVTGSSRGVGRNVAEALAKEGADVLVNYSASEGPAMTVSGTDTRYGSQIRGRAC